MSRSRIARLAVAVLLLGLAAPCGAAVCLAEASLLAFGLYESLIVSNYDSAGTVTVTCTPGLGNPLRTDYTIKIAGTGANGDTVRSAVKGSQRLFYQVYSDAARSVVWGNGTTSGPGVASSVTSVTTVLPAIRIHNVYARMAGGQQVQPGLYLGSLLVTVDY